MPEDKPELELPEHVLEFIQTHSTLTLATASAAAVPHASAYLYVNDGPALYLWTRPETTTAQHLEQNPTVAFTIGDDVADPRQARGVQGTGECAVLLNGTEIARVAHLFGQRFPELSPGNTLSIAFYRISPSSLEFVDNTSKGGRPPEGTFGAEFHKERAYSVYDRLPRHEVESFVATLQTMRLQPGDVVVRQGGPADKYFIVAEGELEIVRDDEDAERLGPGQFFGEMAIIRDTPRRATVRATQPTTLLALDRETFRDVVSQAIGTTRAFDEIIASRLGLRAGE
jgi:CRP-like cAMP-binding protein/nitroimidazol reductase NimA-like FMN-containing flavoprotein (pyridoxamine 5'-phosphate oxidase superfamily)